METATIREWATDAIRYWEPRRILYNLVLAADRACLISSSRCPFPRD